jgi:hypothetical protein
MPKQYHLTKGGNLMISLRSNDKSGNPYMLLVRKIKSKAGTDLYSLKLCKMVYDETVHTFKVDFDQYGTQFFDVDEWKLFLKTLGEL